AVVRVGTARRAPPARRELRRDALQRGISLRRARRHQPPELLLVRDQHPPAGPCAERSRGRRPRGTAAGHDDAGGRRPAARRAGDPRPGPARGAGPGLRLTPVDYLGLSYNATVNLEGSSIRGQAVGLFLREPWWTAPTLVRNYQTATTVGVSYRVVESSANRDVDVKGPEAALLSTAG